MYDDETSDSESSGSEDLGGPSDYTTSLPPGYDDSNVPPEELVVQSTDESAAEQVDDPRVIHARAYQVEMFEESLRQNIIVAMDTGSGKTQVAVLRIQAELEKSPADQMIWFLVPTLALCDQQYEVVKSQIPAVQVKVLSGAYNYETWSEQRIWDDYLRNVRVVVATYQVLLDAVNHGFVRLHRLSLIVFDEAHNCTKNHAGSKLMARYRQEKMAGSPVPWILGLTASPVMRSDPGAIDEIERTLDAVCKSPSVHRAELMETVKRPTLSCVFYTPSGEFPYTTTMKSLIAVFGSMNIYEDPYIVHLRSQDTERSRVALEKSLRKRDTFVFKQFKSLCHKSTEILNELGPWAADYFIHTSLEWYLDSVSKNDSFFETWQSEEKQYLARALRRVTIAKPPPIDHDIATLSDKVIVLIRELLAANDDTIGIVFVRETATVAILTHMLSQHPQVRSRFRVGSMIGTSNYAQRKRDLGDLIKAKSTVDLEAFRAGRLNLLVATNVLEEGIDVPACNLVVCFDRPVNLKSFIQRRGRARMRESKLILLLDGMSKKHSEWIALEEEMRKRYEDDMRQAQELAEIEESEDHPNVKPLYIPSTGAQLDFDQARSHLEHFCSIVAARQYVNARPYYLIEEVPQAGYTLLRATVVLPSSLPPELRRVKGTDAWFSEKNACKDASFQAFLGLYKAGLVNDNLMPLVEEMLEGIDPRSSMVDAAEPWNPWRNIAYAWDKATVVQQRRVSLKDGDNVICEYDLSLPCDFPDIPSFSVYWDKENTWTVEFGGVNIVSLDTLGADQSAALVDLANGHRFTVADDRLALHVSSTEEVRFAQHVGQQPIERGLLNCKILVREHPRSPFFFQEWLPSRPSPELVQYIPKELLEEPVDVPWLAVKKWPKRRDFLHVLQNKPSAVPSGKPYQTIRPAHLFRMDGVDVSKAYFGALIPSIMHMVEIHLKAHILRETILKDIGFSDMSLVMTAISASGANETTNYERLEFLGDSLLKLLTTLSVAANSPPYYPESYLSPMKDRVVSNSRLYRCTIETGLDKFILTKKFSASKWRPSYLKDLLNLDPNATETKTMSSKTLADVIEALIGAAWLDGGMSKALLCVKRFIPQLEWQRPDVARDILLKQKETSPPLPPTLAPLEELIGYSFRNKGLLIEATTHASYDLSTSSGFCMERLEFIGDAILDNIITSELWPHTRLTHYHMHLMRAATVNADLLGLLMMEWSVPQEVTAIRADRTTAAAAQPLPFWKFMRHVDAGIGAAQRAAEAAHEAGREAVLEALRAGTAFPWAQLAHLRIPKFVSDMFESVLGAVFIDSGSMAACRLIVERAGVLGVLRRLRDGPGVDARHPKNKVGELLGSRKIRYETEARRRAGSSDGGDGVGDSGTKEYVCRVYVDERMVVEVGGGVSHDEVIKKAAEEAYQRRDEWNERKDESMGK
ncbi:RNase3 domain-containing protein [Biscogniauxia sp. FL1348]|nr:RNase3 domain-containing protein [Biscogniauxia sp. FL1348]